jgi:N-acetylmuramoyl-L-alanine amidase
MKPFAALVIVIALPLLLYLSPARADTISVGDYTQPGNFTIVYEHDEILAPVLQGLGNAGYNYITRGHTLVLTTGSGRTLTMELGDAAAKLDDTPLTLRCAPRLIGSRWYLPLNSLAEPLGYRVVLDEAKGSLQLLPTLSSMKVQEENGQQSVVLEAQVPIKYRAGKLVDPPRAFLDIANVTLREKAQQIKVNAGILLAVRAAEQETDKAGMRVVLDLTGPAEPQIQTSRNGCVVRMLLPAKAEIPQTAPATLQKITFARTSTRVAAIELSLSAPAGVNSELSKDGRTLTVRLYNTDSKVEELPAIDDEVVEAIALQSLGKESNVQELRIRLKDKARHLLIAQGKTVRIMIGEFSLAGIKIVIDAGHGGCQSGAAGRSGVLEKNLNLAMALKLEALLEQAGAKVYMTRREDSELAPIARGADYKATLRAELRMRPAIATSVGADLFISIHCNANDTDSKHGTEVYYWTPQSKKLAETLEDEVVNSLGRKRNGVFGTHDFWVIKEGAMPSALVEVAYISNAEEEKLLTSDEFQMKAAKGIFTGISRYIAEGGILGVQAAPAPVQPVVNDTASDPNNPDTGGTE